MIRSLVTAILAFGLLAPPSAGAKVIRSGHYAQAFYPDRLSAVIGFIPVTIGGRSRRVEIRVGKNVYRGPWKSFTVSRNSTSEALKYMTRDARGRYGDLNAGLFADRPLTAREKRNWKVVADIARDADVLAVAKSHPACANGLTLTQARDIAAGRVTRWSQVGAGGPDVPDAIRLGFTEQQDVFERRFGTTRAPKGARRSFDGGVGSAANGDRSVAVVTSWSRLRGDRSVCAVKLNGIEPTAASVHALEYAGAYAMTFVVNRRPPRTAYERAKRKAYIKYLLSERTGKRWKDNGLILASETPTPPAPAQTPPPPPPPPPSGDAHPAPSSDAQGRPITAARDDDGVRAALAGERFDFSHSGGSERYAFDPGGVLHMLTFAAGGGCSQLDGTWQLLAGWRYPEHGGGTIARVHISAPGTSGDVTLDMPGDAPATAYWNGQPYSRSREVPGTC